MAINTTITSVEDDWTDNPSHEEWVARKAAEQGFPVVGFLSEIYVDAVILWGAMFKSDWKPGKVKLGRVIEIIDQGSVDSIVSFVLLTEDGTQVPYAHGGGWACFFALPEDSENSFRKVK